MRISSVWQPTSTIDKDGSQGRKKSVIPLMATGHKKHARSTPKGKLTVLLFTGFHSEKDIS